MRLERLRVRLSAVSLLDSDLGHVVRNTSVTKQYDLYNSCTSNKQVIRNMSSKLSLSNTDGLVCGRQRERQTDRQTPDRCITLTDSVTRTAKKHMLSRYWISCRYCVVFSVILLFCGSFLQSMRLFSVYVSVACVVEQETGEEAA